jgi:hypothetical protein
MTVCAKTEPVAACARGVHADSEPTPRIHTAAATITAEPRRRLPRGLTDSDKSSLTPSPECTKPATSILNEQ